MTQEEALLELEQIDLDERRLRAKFKSPVEAKAVEETRKAKAALVDKLSAARKLEKILETDIAKAEESRDQLEKRLRECQAKLDEGTDYKTTDKLITEMASISQQRDKVSADIDEKLEQQIKVEDAITQIEQMVDKATDAEENARKALDDVLAPAKQSVLDWQKHRQELLSVLDEKTAARYKKIYDEKANAPVCHCGDDMVCSVCRSTISPLQYTSIKSSISECPNCHRIMVIPEKTQQE